MTWSDSEMKAADLRFQDSKCIQRYEMTKDLMVVHPVGGPIFIIAWVLIAAFIFQNIVLGFLNNNFAGDSEKQRRLLDNLV